MGRDHERLFTVTVLPPNRHLGGITNSLFAMLSILLLPFIQDNAEDSAYNDNLILLQYHFITWFFCNTVF